MTLTSGAPELRRAAEHDLTVPALLARRARSAPDAQALLAPQGETIAYEALEARVAALAGRLAELGVRAGDRVASVVANGPDAALAFLASASAATSAPLNPSYTKDELEFFLDDLEPRALIVGAAGQSPARGVAEARGLPVLDLAGETLATPGASVALAPAPDDVALVLHTSGTTSKPKLVPLTHRNLCVSARNIATTLGLSERDRCLNVMPLFHIHGLVAALLTSLSAGASVVCTPGFHAPSFFGWLEELEPTWYTAVPTMHQAILARAEGHDGVIARRALRFVRSSSAALPPDVLAGLEVAFGVPAVEAYGMTEAAHQMASNPLPPGERKPGSVGLPAGPQIAVLDEAGAQLPVGEAGEVAIRGESVFGGYLGDGDANTRAFTDGWFRTGDLGVLDEDGYLFIQGRLKEIINRGGEKIAPREVDEALLMHPAVEQAVAFGVPDPRLGEEVAAAVVLRDGAEFTERELQEHVAARLVDFKVPRRVVFVDEIPRGPTGKLQRIGLAETLGITEIRRDPGRDAPYIAPRTPVEEELAALFASTLGVERVGVTDDFFQLGGDSLLGAELLTRIRDRYDRHDLLLSVLLWAPTVEQLAVEIDRGRPRRKRSLVVQLEDGTGTPCFWVHGLDGGVLPMTRLARSLASRPFYGIRARGVESRGRPARRVEDMARTYLREVRRIQTRGPYVLGGMCAGGPIALEMAQQLAATGEEVALVVVIDPRIALEPPTVYRPEPGARRRLRWWLGRLHLLEIRLERETRRRLFEATARPHEAAESSQRHAMAYLWRARDRYRPQPYHGRVLGFLTREAPNPRGVWDAILDDVQWHDLASTHEQAMKPPAVDVLAGHVNAAREELGV